MAFFLLEIEKKHWDTGVSGMRRSTKNPNSIPTKLPKDLFFLVEGLEWFISNTGRKSMDYELSRFP